MKINFFQIKTSPDTYIIETNYRLTLYTPRLFRIEYSKQGLFDEEMPIPVEPEFRNEDYITKEQYKIFSKDEKFFVETEYFLLELVPNGKMLDIGSLYVRNKRNNFVWYPSVVDDGNLGGAMLDLYKYPAGKFYERFTEGLISKNKIFVYRNICEFLYDKNTSWIKKRKDWQFQDFFIFVYDNYKEIFYDFVLLFGRIPMIPRWCLGLWYSRWYKYKDKDLIDVVKKFRELNIPIDVIVVDTDWRKHGWTGYEWNKEFFVDYKEFLKQMDELHIHCGLNDHPGYGTSEKLPEDDPFKEKIKNRIPDIKEYYIKWDDERYVNAWIEEIFKKFIEDGFSFWWVDGWGGSYCPMEVNPQLWTNKAYFESVKRTSKRPVILSRWGGIGAHKYPVQFSGDTYPTFETLKYQIEFTHKGGNIGACFWSHDIGSFLGEKLSEDLYIRWVQFGCFSPIMRLHSSGATRLPWEYSEKTVEIFKKYVQLRYILNPYYYSLSRQTYEKGLPIIRGLYIEYPEDENAYKYTTEYLIGENILVAPVYQPNEKVLHEVYFPKGLWIDLENNEIIKGECVKTIVVPLDKIPWYIKIPSIIVAFPLYMHLDFNVEEIHFYIFPNEETVEFEYYEDDGISQKYLSGEFLKQKIVAKKMNNKIVVQLEQPKGKYEGMNEKINYVFKIFLNNEKVEKIVSNIKETEVGGSNKAVGFETQFEFYEIKFQNINRNESLEIEIFLKNF